MRLGKVLAVCTSPVRGVQKENRGRAHLCPEWGLEGDAHGGNWHRQVSLLSAERIAEFNQRGGGVKPGAFGENLVVAGIDFRTLPVGTLLRCGGVLLEVTQIGKDCHSRCAIFDRMGECIMPREGVFARGLEPGDIAVGDEMHVEPRNVPRPFQAAVITLSDRCAAGERADQSGPAVTARLRENGYAVVEELLLPDDQKRLERELIRLADQRQVDLILTAGGTGFSPRDVSPEAALAVADRQAPGIAEAIRAASMKITPRAMLSRGVSVIRGRTLIINLPGSPKACLESMDVFLEQLPHGLELLRGIPQDCGR